MKDIDGIEHVLTVLEPHWAEIEGDFNRNNRRFLELAAADHEAIGKVLRAHLTIEAFLDDYLSENLGIDELRSLRLTFFQKAMLLPIHDSSAAFVRPGILQINTVRNKLGHRPNYAIKDHEVSAIYKALAIARAGREYQKPIDAIEAFSPIACAFLSVPPPHLQELFMEAFKNVRSHEPDGATI